MEGKHKNYCRAVCVCENKNPRINLAMAKRGSPSQVLTLERIYLLKYEIYIPLNKLFSQTAIVLGGGGGGGMPWNVRYATLHKATNTFCMAIICFLFPRPPSCPPPKHAVEVGTSPFAVSLCMSLPLAPFPPAFLLVPFLF